jgi:hypothetical protein
MHNIKGAVSIEERLEPVCTECMVLFGGAVPQFANGTSLGETTTIYNHHVFTLNHARRERHATCPGDAVQAPKYPGIFIGGGTEREAQVYTSPDGTLKSGYHFNAATDKVDVIAEFMNYRPPGQNIYLSFEYEYLLGKPAGYQNAVSLILSASNCKDSPKNIQEKKYTLQSKEWIAPADGILINVRGHLHDG